MGLEHGESSSPSNGETTGEISSSTVDNILDTDLVTPEKHLQRPPIMSHQMQSHNCLQNAAFCLQLYVDDMFQVPSVARRLSFLVLNDI